MKTNLRNRIFVAIIGALISFSIGAKPSLEYRAKSIAYTQLPKLLIGKKANFLYSGDLAEQILTAAELSIGNEDGPQRLPGDFVMFSGCRRESCQEKSAAIIDLRTNKTIGAAIRHFNCSSECESDATIDYFIFNYPKFNERSSTALMLLQTWATRVGFFKYKIHHCNVLKEVAVCD